MKRFLQVGLIASTLMLTSSAWAALGGTPTLPVATVVSSTSQAAVAVLRATTPTTYTVRSATVGGVNEREYLNVDGTVFAIAWDGPFYPDLKTFMGSDLFQQYAAAIKAAQTPVIQRSGSLGVTTDGVVAQISGHQGALRGRAYVPNLIPSGLDLNVVQ